uniref:Chemokine interleukin-8-like domain-containing protein n=1 Tax=Dicentrarchus labrax TaxID=13489 RepID=A0A8C4HMV0_DICLA
MYSTFRPCAYLWVLHAQLASSINECVGCVGRFKKGLAVQTTHHICLSHRQAMTSLTFVFLLLATMMVSTASAQGGIGNCCRSISNTQVHRDLLKNYYTQNRSSCPIRAVVFTTLKGKRICSDPTKRWTQTSMAYLDGKNWTIQHKLNT